MAKPPDLGRVDLAAADPALRAAPLHVRQASAWLNQHGSRDTRTQLLVVAGGLLALGCVAAATVLALIIGDEGFGVGCMLAAMAVVGVTAQLYRQSSRTARWARSTVDKWKALNVQAEDAGL